MFGAWLRSQPKPFDKGNTMMATESADYQAPQLTEIGSIRNVTRGSTADNGQDSFSFFGFTIPVPGGSNPHHGS
jgi:hypothetical protein